MSKVVNKPRVSKGVAVVTNWETFISYDCVNERKEYLRIDECGLKGISSEHKES